MGEKKCSLCEGRIVDGRCQECGMVYRQIQGRYYMNENRPSGEKVSEPAAPGYKKNTEQPDTGRMSYQQEKGRKVQPKKNGDKTAQKIGLIIAIAAILVSLVSKYGLKDEEYSDAEVTVPVEVTGYEQNQENIYASVTRELSSEGEAFETKLGAGFYTVGQQIPEGTYRVTGGDWLVFYVDDRENNIFNSWWTSEYRDENQEVLIEDVRLYQGAVLEVTGAGELVFYTENGQTDQMEEAQDNPLTQEVQLSTDELVAGTDFETGMYDLEMVEGAGSVLTEGENGVQTFYILNAASDYTEKSYRNVLLEDGMKIRIEKYEDGTEEETCTVVLKPSAQVYSRQS